VVSFPADLAQFWGAILGSGGVWRGCLTTWNDWHWSFIILGVMLDILHQVSKRLLLQLV